MHLVHHGIFSSLPEVFIPTHGLYLFLHQFPQRPWTSVSSHGAALLPPWMGWGLAPSSNSFSWHHRPVTAQSRVASPAPPCTAWWHILILSTASSRKMANLVALGSVTPAQSSVQPRSLALIPPSWWGGFKASSDSHSLLSPASGELTDLFIQPLFRSSAHLVLSFQVYTPFNLFVFAVLPTL